MSIELAVSVAIFAGYLAAILFFAWPTGHLCHDPHCTKEGRLK